MYSLSLLSYSLSYPHKRDPQPALAKAPAIILPPIHNVLNSAKPRQQVLHPKINLLTYPAAAKSPALPLNSTSRAASLTHPYTQPLTEHNLSLRNDAQAASNYATGIPSPPKSVLLVGLDLPSLLPSVSKAQLRHVSTSSVLAPAYGPAPGEGIAAATPISGLLQATILGKKRRQRLGPSCDLCRQRKVKCNAEISILLTSPEEFQSQYKTFMLLTDDEKTLLAGSAISIEAGVQLVIQNDKLVKFRLCKLCDVKHFVCCFLKGFTKEDIVTLSKKNNTAVETNKVTKPVPHMAKVDRALKTLPKKLLKFDPNLNRKSSCTLCRQRKVKCLFSEALGRCENCHRKNKSCLFDC